MIGFALTKIAVEHRLKVRMREASDTITERSINGTSRARLPKMKLFREWLLEALADGGA